MKDLTGNRWRLARSPMQIPLGVLPRQSIWINGDFPLRKRRIAGFPLEHLRTHDAQENAPSLTLSRLYI